MDYDFSALKLVVGLGNVGDRYRLTRHNAGFLFADKLLNDLAADVAWKHDNKLQCEIAKVGDLRIIKPTTMMNRSGVAVRAAMDYFEINPEQVLIAHDDLDIPLGKSKLQFNKYPKVHNGINSVLQHVKNDNMWFMRLGIENREVKGNSQIPGVVYSLKRFPAPELEEFNKALKEAGDKVLRNQPDRNN